MIFNRLIIENLVLKLPRISLINQMILRMFIELKVIKLFRGRSRDPTTGLFKIASSKLIKKS